MTSDRSELQRLQAEFAAAFQARRPQHTLLVEPDPLRFLAAFLAASHQPGRLWLANPRWGATEWQQVARQCEPDLIVGEMPNALADAWRDRPTLPSVPSRTTSPKGILLAFPSPAQDMMAQTIRDNYLPAQILIPTGGSSGNIRFAVHTWATLAASVQGFCHHFQAITVNAYCVLPLFHVSGLMQALRCFLTGGQLVIQPFQTLLREGAIASLTPPLPPSPSHSFLSHSFLSLVPTQLQRLLNSDRDLTWLRQFTAILLGGAPSWPSLLDRARDFGLPLSLTYGMTETASQVATLLPHEFLTGNTSSGRPLPHACITICDEAGQSLPAMQTGFITIQAASLAWGYGSAAIAPQHAIHWGNADGASGASPNRAPLLTGDLGYFDEAGYLHVLGRQQTLIVTGGEKVLPEEVEATILATGLVVDVAVVGVPDEDWGERVVAVIGMNSKFKIQNSKFQETREPHSGAEIQNPKSKIQNPTVERLRQLLKGQLSAYKVPKDWLLRAGLPRNEQGKLNRVELRQWAIQQLQSNAGATELARASGEHAGESLC